MTRSKVIYRIYFPSNDKSYVGQTLDFRYRMVEHSRSGNLLGRALRKYADWICYELFIVTEEYADMLEIIEIAHYNSMSPNGYNLTSGGRSYRASEEIKKKMSRNNAMYRLEEREKVSKALKGRKNPKQNEAIRGRKNPSVSESNRRRKGEKKPGVGEALRGRKRPGISKALIKYYQKNPGKHKKECNTPEAKENQRRAQQGKKASEETKVKMRKVKQGKNNPNYGKKLSYVSKRNKENNPMKNPAIVLKSLQSKLRNRLEKRLKDEAEKG